MYIGAFLRWKLWAETRQEAPSFPVQEVHIVLQHLSQTVNTEDFSAGYGPTTALLSIGLRAGGATAAAKAGCA